MQSGLSFSRENKRENVHVYLCIGSSKSSIACLVHAFPLFIRTVISLQILQYSFIGNVHDGII